MEDLYERTQETALEPIVEAAVETLPSSTMLVVADECPRTLTYAEGQRYA